MASSPATRKSVTSLDIKLAIFSFLKAQSCSIPVSNVCLNLTLCFGESVPALLSLTLVISLAGFMRLHAAADWNPLTSAVPEAKKKKRNTTGWWTQNDTKMDEVFKEDAVQKAGGVTWSGKWRGKCEKTSWSGFTPCVSKWHENDYLSPSYLTIIPVLQRHSQNLIVCTVRVANVCAFPRCLKAA